MKNKSINAIGTYECRHMTRWERFVHKTKMFFHKVLKVTAGVMAVSFIGLTTFSLGAGFATPNVTTVTAQINQIALPPILKKIEMCESGGNQFDKNGQVLMHYNPSSNSIDIGVMQVNNAIWGKQATSMGYNLSNEEDNIKFALYLYANYGTEPWRADDKCLKN